MGSPGLGGDVTIEETVVGPTDVDSGRDVVPLSDRRLPPVVEEPDQFAGPPQTFQRNLNARSGPVDMPVEGEMEQVVAVASAWIRRTMPNTDAQRCRGIRAPRSFMIGKGGDLAWQVDIPTAGSGPPVRRAVRGKQPRVVARIGQGGHIPGSQTMDALHPFGLGLNLGDRGKAESDQG